MGFDSMKTLPNMIKPVTLFLIILQTFFIFFPKHHPFLWFAITTTILQLIFTILIFAVFFLEIPAIVQAPMWPLAEMIYSAVFAVCSGIDFFYFIVNMFGSFNVFLLFSVGTSALLTLTWALNAFLWFKARNVSSSSNDAPGYGNNQATATPAAGNFPYPAGHQTGINPA